MPMAVPKKSLSANRLPVRRHAHLRQHVLGRPCSKIACMLWVMLRMHDLTYVQTRTFALIGTMARNDRGWVARITAECALLWREKL